jgi:GDP-L-fucose synthase
MSLVNIGCCKDVSTEELLEMLLAEVGFEGQLVFDTTKSDGTSRKLMDVSKINNLRWSYDNFKRRYRSND